VYETGAEVGDVGLRRPSITWSWGRLTQRKLQRERDRGERELPANRNRWREGKNTEEPA